MSSLGQVRNVTVPQGRALAILYNRTHTGGVLYPAELAEALWPDSPGWGRRARRMATTAGGALGATMPMKAAQLLWRLRGKGYAELGREPLTGATSSNRWRITEAGVTEHLQNGIVE